MSVAIITGANGLIGSEAAIYFAELGFDIVGIDNNMRKVFFGEEASNQWNQQRLTKRLGLRYTHVNEDIRNKEAIENLFAKFGSDIAVVIHTAAQPSHDWAANNPHIDFTVNANGTLNLLEATRQHAPTSPFIFTSTNKVYGDRPNYLPLVEQETRWEIADDHLYKQGIKEDMSIDQTLHSLFGVSKVAADLLVQEYGRYFELPTACFRGGCLTGPNHSGTQLHGFLAYLVKCAVTGTKYTVFGYKAKQVRDNIHSHDLITAFHAFYKAPRVAEVYNIGGGRHSNCSMLEAIKLCERLTGKEMNWDYSDDNRIGDHMWYISNLDKFQTHYPDWQLTYNVSQIIDEIYATSVERWNPAS